MLFKCDTWSIFPFHLGALAPPLPPTAPFQYGFEMFHAFFFLPLPSDAPSWEREGCVNNAKQTLNVRAKNSQFPPIVSLASTACFMHFIISAGASEERSGGEGGLAVMGIAYFCGGVLRRYRTSFERQISQILGVENHCRNSSLNQ